MEVKIGIVDVTRELSVRTDVPPADLVKSLDEALQSGGLFELSDTKGRKIVVPSAKVAYLDLGASDERPVGFGAV